MQKLNITKTEFLEILQNIREQQNKNDEFSKALEKMCDGYIVFGSNNKYFESLLFVLSKMFYQDPNEEGNTIDWYLFEGHSEDNEHTMMWNGYEMNFNTDELIWELLCAEFEMKANDDVSKMDELFATKGTPITKEEYLEKYNIKEIGFERVSGAKAMELIEDGMRKKFEQGEFI